MPTYDYRCTSCGAKHEIFQKISDDSVTTCPSCQNASLERGFGGGVGLHFKGSGFYLTDYCKSTCECKSSQE